MTWQALYSNPSVRTRLEQELRKLRSGSDKPMHGRSGAEYGQYNAYALDAGIDTRRRHAVRWRETVLALPGAITERCFNVKHTRLSISRVYCIYSNGSAYVLVSPKLPAAGVHTLDTERMQAWLQSKHSVVPR